LCTLHGARAETLYVGPSEVYTAIQPAIDAALDGDVIIVRDGVYTGDGNRDISFAGKKVSLESENGAGSCTLDLQGSAEDQHRGFIFTNGETAESVVKGFTITGAYNQNIGTRSGIGGAFFCDGGASPTIIDNIIVDNYASSRGAAIACYNGSAIIVDNVIANNGGGRGCSGIMGWWDPGVMRDDPIVVTGNLIAKNSAIFGGGSFIWGASAIFTNNTFFANTATGSTDPNNMGHGGGVILNGGSKVPAPVTIVTNCIFWDNVAEWPDGTGDQISVQSGNDSTISYCDVQGGLADVCINPAGGVAPTWGDGNIDADPLFADAANGDLHLKSTGGRWDATAGDWVKDAQTSPCVDTGDPASDYSTEPEPNGGRINMGAYGNTAEASKAAAPPRKPMVVWEWQCDKDPTTIDDNGDTYPDWTGPSGAPFAGTIEGGIYKGGQQIWSTEDNFDTPLVMIEARWKAEPGATIWDQHIWIPIDSKCEKGDPDDPATWQWTISPMFFFLTSDGTTQTIRIENVDRWWGQTLIAEITGLPNDYLATKITFNTVEDTFVVLVNGVKYGPYTYKQCQPPVGSGTAQVFAIAGGGPSYLDYVYIAKITPPVVWEWDCSVDPTMLDANGDTVRDWNVRGAVNPGSFDAGKLVDGLWLGGQTLDTHPKYLFDQNPITIDIRWRATAAGAWKACFWINFNYNGITFSPNYCFIENDGTSQKLTFFTVQDPGWTTITLGTIEGLPTDMIDMRWDVDIETNQYTVSVNGEEKATYTYVPKAGSYNHDRYATVLGGAVEFDYVKISGGKEIKAKTWPIPGDSNMDCRVNILDLIFIRNRLNTDVTSGDNWQADVNEDGRINILDLIFTRNALGTQCPE